MGCHLTAVVQYTFTYKQYTERHKTSNTQNNTKILEDGKRCPVFAGYTLTFALQPRKKYGKTYFIYIYVCVPCVVGPCHHGMARPQVADRGTASNMEGSCE